MPARLVFITGSRSGTALDLGEEDVTFGRRTDRTIVFSPDEVLVSAEHATLRFRDGKYVIRDDGSSNGTFVNADKIADRTLSDGDVIQFGPGGPAARFTFQTEAGVAKTLRPSELAAAYKLIEQTKLQQAGAVVATTQDAKRETTREIVRHSARRTRIWLTVIAVIAVAAGGAVTWMLLSRARLERNLAALSSALAAEQASRSALAEDVAAVGARYDSLQSAVQQGQERLARDPRIDARAMRDFSRGVALIVFWWGYEERDGGRLLRYNANAQGPPSMVPRNLTFGGSGPPLERQATATGFLIDSAGWIITNRHVSEPWVTDEELDAIRTLGWDVQGKLLEIRAYFPPGEKSFPLTMGAASEEADVAVMRIRARVDAPTLPLAEPAEGAEPGDRLIFIGYPTGVHNLLFRVSREDRKEILDKAGDDGRILVEELARRRLIQPLITQGSVGDITEGEVIHMADATVGGSGGPLIDMRQHVVAVHYAVVLSPAPGDPFRTQRGVPIRFAWEILPASVRATVTRH